ncbi:MAG: acyl-ACP desaturase [Flavobacteriales bacterium]|nr:acyl-ACP desaturase [Flavobacteriales bacterium]
MTKISEVVEIMKDAESKALPIVRKYLAPPEKLWQPADFLPVTTDPKFPDSVREIQELSKALDYDLFSVLIGDTITEEALPTYQTWLMQTEGFDQQNSNTWATWLRGWTAEENRHGDLLNTYLYLSGRVDMWQFQVTVQYLIQDGFFVGMEHNPYKSFVYTSFQELATNITHRRVATACKAQGNAPLAKICATIASDEKRHANAYMDFINLLFEYNPSDVIIDFAAMMKHGILMPGHMMQEFGEGKGDIFNHFSNSAARLEIYTGRDYVVILEKLLKRWDIEHRRELNDEGQRARDYLMKLPGRLEAVIKRSKVPQERHRFKWLH